ncbi:MAG: HAD-IB family hydrolase [Rhodococcus sp.]|nr:HAD-IB family hydrolase [Rhodococcus sp. (in: high G+C Gram-positive bacteria)]
MTTDTGPTWATAQRTGSTQTPHRVAAFFDLDKTIIAKSSTLAFSRPLFAGGLINRRAVLKSSYAQFLFMLSGADHDQMERIRSNLTSLTEGWNVEQVRAIVAETLHEIVDPLVYAEATHLIADHHARGHDVIVVSASGYEVVKPIAEMLGVDHTIATQLAVVDGKYTGEVDFYCYGDGKVKGMAECAEERGYDLTQCYAYSDSITDLPMLEAVGYPTAVNPDRGLRKVAIEHGWPILSFSNPVSMRARLTSPSPSIVASAAVLFGAAVAIGALTYSALRRRR